MNRLGKKIIPLTLLLSSCGQDLPNLEPADAPLIGVPGQADSADDACHVVLREAGRVSDRAGGYLTNGSSWLWRGEIDVSDAAVSEQAIPRVLYQYGSDPTWYQVDAVPAAGPPAGATRYRFEMHSGLPGPGMSGTSLARARIKLIPFLALATGGRLFDHNRIADPVGSYVLEASGNFEVPAEATTCQPPSSMTAIQPAEVTLDFTADRRVEQIGAIWWGSPLTVDYAIERLTSCRGTHNGHPAWDLLAHVRFLPQGTVVSGSVREFESPGGVPVNVAHSIPFVTEVPHGTERIEVWFENYTGAGSSCRAWDSNDSRNYAFDVLKPTDWLGNSSIKITRAGGTPCGDSESSRMSTGFGYGTWARQRSVFGHVCFEAYQQGTTDWNNPDIWRALDARVYYRFDPSEPFTWRHLSLVDRVGNNARYVFDVAALDPFRPYRCPDVPITVSNGYEEARMEFLFVVNGAVHQQESGAPFEGVYADYPNNPWRTANCP